MKTKVLAIDDSRTIRNLLAATLEEAGFEYVSAVDGREGVDMYEDVAPDVVITDINMPNLDGLGLLRAIRAHPPTQGAAFIMLTGRADRELVARAVQFGVNNYLVKPFTVAQLKEKLEGVFGPLT